MTFNLAHSIVYDIETFPNVFTLDMECLYSDQRATWEISHYRDDRAQLREWLNWMHQTQTPMIGFNNLAFDYTVVHFILQNPHSTVEQIYEKAMSIINSTDRFTHTIWPSDRLIPQIDLFTINHFNNVAKSTSLKALQINMRSPSVVDMPIDLGSHLTKEQIDGSLIPYNQHDVKETKRFAHYNEKAISFRLGLIEQFGIDVLNWNDTKIGSKMMEQRLGDNLCFDRSSGRKKTRQTPRTHIAFADIIFPYVQFETPEFQRVFDYLRQQTLEAEEISLLGNDETPKLKTKGVFNNLTARVGDIEFHFGTGGIHGSVEKQKITAGGGWIIRDIDVASLYPSIAIVNRLAPEHLGQHFVETYAELPKERKRWQAEKGKKCVEANTLKLASNGVYGNSNNQYSPFYDPKFTLTITVNGQLLLCMLAEKIIKVPSLTIIQINTDGITYFVHEDDEARVARLCKEWETLTLLALEDADYSRMWIRDVNSYIAEYTNGELKVKGAYWTPDPLDWHGSISNAQPPAWHKNLSNIVSTRAAMAQMVYGVPIEEYIRACKNPYDFVCYVKIKRSDVLEWGGQQQQRTSRYYLSTAGKPLKKTAPPVGTEGSFKRANGVTETMYRQIMQETNWQWDERVCTKNRSVYEKRETMLHTGYKVKICNDIQDFDFADVDYEWYVTEAKKLLVG